MRLVTSIVVLALLCGIGVGSLRADDQAAARTKDQILADINAVKVPNLDQSKIKDQEYVRQYLQERSTTMHKKSDLIGELYKAYPDAPELNKLLLERWNTLPGGAAGTVNEIGSYLTAHPTSAEAEQYATMRAQIQVQLLAKTTADRLAAIDEFKKYASSDKAKNMVPAMLFTALRSSGELSEKKELAERITKEYPDSPVVRQVEGEMRKAEAVGKPMVLAFNEAITGKPMSMEGLKGKIVVMDFWATWCGPCVAEMPKMKKIYAEFKDKGVEFVGVSLDQPEDKGGLKALKEFCAKNEITWPQYYQGNYWQSEFSSKWGINAIPCVFVIGPDGNIVTTEARGKLEEILPEQIKKRAEKVAGE
jgi:thiol-disulfide isomerase/thioredoxin